MSVPGADRCERSGPRAPDEGNIRHAKTLFKDFETLFHFRLAGVVRWYFFEADKNFCRVSGVQRGADAVEHAQVAQGFVQRQARGASGEDRGGKILYFGGVTVGGGDRDAFAAVAGVEQDFALQPTCFQAKGAAHSGFFIHG